jgi:hypothetical protein
VRLIFIAHNTQRLDARSCFARQQVADLSDDRRWDQHLSKTCPASAPVPSRPHVIDGSQDAACSW